MIGSAEPSPGLIVHDEADKLFVGAFPTSNINPAVPERRAEEFVEIYSKAGKTNCQYSPNVLHDRWKKLVFNAALNPICAITGLDDGRIRLADGALDGLVRPAMREIVAAAKAVSGVELTDDVVEATINVDPLESYLKPSMQQDLEKVRFYALVRLTKVSTTNKLTTRRAILSNLRTWWASHLGQGKMPVFLCLRLRSCITFARRYNGGQRSTGGLSMCQRNLISRRANCPLR